MAYDCTKLRNNLAKQTPVYDSVFLDDFISDMTTAPYLGRHMTEVWGFEADTVYFDKVHVGQANYLTPWATISGAECGANPCEPPNSFIGFGTSRDSAFMEQITLRSQPFCLQQLATVPHVGQQIGKIYKYVRKIPLGFTGDFVRTRTVSYHDTLQICDSGFTTFGITTANTAANLVTINLGVAGNLPESELTWQYLTYLSQYLGLRGYDSESGIAAGMRGLITHQRTWMRLVGQNPEVKSLLHLVGVKDVSPLYQMGKGVNADPFGNYVPTFDEHQPRFQHSGNGLLQRVLPYHNDPATTGEKPVVNAAWLNARYAISTIIHPKATMVYTSKPKRIHEMVPTVNSSMWGQWKFINPEGLINWYNPDGTTCTKNNDQQFYFYWLCHLQLGFRYDQRDLIMPILHLIDGSGKDCMVNSPVCGNAPEYVVQDYSDNPTMCET